MAKGKKKNNNNKNVDVVEQIEKEKTKNEEEQKQQTDTIKQNNQQKQQNQTQQKVQDNKKQQNTQVTTQSLQQPKNDTQNVQVEEVTKKQLHDQIHSQVTQPSADQPQVLEQPGHTIQQVPPAQLAAQDKKDLPKQEDKQAKQQVQNKQDKPQQLVAQENKDKPKEEENKIQNKPQEENKQQKQAQTVQHPQLPAQVTLQRPESIQVKIGTQMVHQQNNIIASLMGPQQTKLGQQNQDLPYRNQLMDGLNLIAKIDEQIMLQNPLQHEIDVHGPPQFIQNFNPAAYHYNQSGLQQIKQPGVTHQKQPDQVLKDKRLDDRQVLQQIKQSGQSLDPDPLDQIVDQKQKINILKSYHSDADQEQKKPTTQSQQKSNEKKESPTEISRKQSVGEKSRRSSTEPKHPDVPAFPLENPSTKSIQRIESAKRLDGDQVNKQILLQREQQWRKLQQKQAQPRRPSFIYAHPPQCQAGQVGSPVKPNVTERLGYTNNLPIINQEKQVRKLSGSGEQHMMKQSTKSPYEQYKQQIKKQKQTIKQKLQQNEKLGKDVNTDNSLRKLSIAALVTAACFGACVLGKVDKRIAGGATVASFIVSYLAQK